MQRLVPGVLRAPEEQKCFGIAIRHNEPHRLCYVVSTVRRIPRPGDDTRYPRLPQCRYSLAASLQIDPAGCPQLDAATSAALVTQLGTAPGGGPAVNNFDKFNVLAIVIAIDKSLVTKSGPILSFWGSTNRP